MRPFVSATLTVLTVVAFIGLNLYLGRHKAEQRGSSSPTSSRAPCPPSYKATLPKQVGTNLLSNPGAEAEERGWEEGHFGKANVKFSVIPDAHTGKNAFLVDVNRWHSGDSKFTQAPKPVQAGKYYLFSDWYKSGTSTTMVVQVEFADGKSKFYLQDLGIPPAPDWHQYRTGFLMPPGAVKAMFHHTIPGDGYLITDDYAMTRYEGAGGFRRPMVSLTFDDSTAATYKALPVLEKYGFRSTQFVVTGTLDTPDGWSTKQLKTAVKSGHEIGSHTVKHPELVSLDTDSMIHELKDSRDKLESIIHKPVRTFAYPYGRYDGFVAEEARKLYCTARTTNPGYTSKVDLNLFSVPVQNVVFTTTLAEYKHWVQYARRHNLWLVLVYHGVKERGGSFTVPYKNFRQQLAYLKRTGVTVKPYEAALEEALAQLRK